MHPRIIAIALTLLGPLTAGAAEPVAHSFLLVGPTFVGIIDEQGGESWDAGKPRGRDGYVLDNGNVLVAWADEVLELTRDHEVVFRYELSPENKEIGSAVRLEEGATLITELGSKPRILEVDTDGNKVAETPLQPETKRVHMQTRMARKLNSGNYLVPHLLAFAVKEYEPSGKVVRTIATDLPELGGRKAETWPFTAIQLEEGATLVTLTHGNQVAEFDKRGNVQWLLTNDDLPGSPLDDPCGAQRLPNGNTVIASYHASGDAIKALEVTPEKEIVWTYSGPHKVHGLHVLTTNGQPIEGKPQK